MNEYDERPFSARDLIASAAFHILSILLFPVSLIGYLIVIGKGLLSWGRSGVSATG